MVKKKNLKSVEDLALFSLEDPILQKKLYKVLKGCQIEGLAGGYPSLYSYLTLRKRPSKINLYSAPYDLLAVLFDEKTARYILEHRAHWKKKSSEPVEPFRAQIMKEIVDFYGADFSKYQDLVTFQTH